MHAKRVLILTVPIAKTRVLTNTLKTVCAWDVLLQWYSIPQLVSVQFQLATTEPFHLLVQPVQQTALNVLMALAFAQPATPDLVYQVQTLAQLLVYAILPEMCWYRLRLSLRTHV